MVDVANAWRTETPGNQGWARTARPGAPNKYFMVSADCHANEPHDWLRSRIEPEYLDRIPHIHTDDDSVKWVLIEGFRPTKLRTTEVANYMQDEDLERNAAGRDPAARLDDDARDGVDVEIIFPNKGLTIWATPDPQFAMAMCRAWNRWAAEWFGGHLDRLCPLAAISPGDKEGSLAGDRVGC